MLHYLNFILHHTNFSFECRAALSFSDNFFLLFYFLYFLYIYPFCYEFWVTFKILTLISRALVSPISWLLVQCSPPHQRQCSPLPVPHGGGIGGDIPHNAGAARPIGRISAWWTEKSCHSPHCLMNSWPALPPKWKHAFTAPKPQKSRSCRGVLAPVVAFSPLSWRSRDLYFCNSWFSGYVSLRKYLE